MRVFLITAFTFLVSAQSYAADGVAEADSSPTGMALIVITLVTFCLGIALNGLFAGYETGFISADRIRVRYLAEEESNEKAKRLLGDLEQPDKMLTVVLIGTNVSLIFGTMALTKALPDAAWLSTLIATPMFLIFAEIIPKSVFRQHPTRLALVFLPAIRFFEYVLFLLVWPTLLCVKLMHKLTGAHGGDTNPMMSTEDDLRHLIDESAARGSIDKGEQEMIHGVMNLQTTQAKEIMIPRTEMLTLPMTASRKELADLFIESGRTRIPLYDETVDSIVGVANVYDVMQEHGADDTTIEGFVRDVIHAPDTKPVDELLQELKQRGEHMAIVTDEYGGTLGLITLEDVLEEIFGEIHDEHDKARDLIQQVGPRNYVVDARMPLEDLSAALKVPIEDDSVETVGGWIMHIAECIPAQGEKIRHGDFRIIILEGTEKRVLKIRLDLLGAPLDND